MFNISCTDYREKWTAICSFVVRFENDNFLLACTFLRRFSKALVIAAEIVKCSWLPSVGFWAHCEETRAKGLVRRRRMNQSRTLESPQKKFFLSSAFAAIICSLIFAHTSPPRALAGRDGNVTKYFLCWKEPKTRQITFIDRSLLNFDIKLNSAHLLSHLNQVIQELCRNLLWRFLFEASWNDTHFKESADKSFESVDISDYIA